MRLLSFALPLLIVSGSLDHAKALRATIGPKDLLRKIAYTHLFSKSDFFSGSLKELIQSDALKLASHITGKVPINEEPLTQRQIALIKEITGHFPNKKLKGYGISTFGELENLTSEEVDISTAMGLLKENKSQESDMAALDWMAWTIEQRLTKGASKQAVIEAINTFIFFDLGIRFPPQSLYSANIDSYTFLSAVLSKRQGVCLGVSVLYLCLAQRLGLDLEIVTPPGHIFVRALIDGTERNIETTARGIDIPTEHYQSVSAPNLKKRTLKDTAALVLVNEASSLWHRKEYSAALERYQRAQRLMPNDALIHELMGICSFLSGDINAAHIYLRAALNCPLELTICRDALSADILQARCDAKSVEAIFMPAERAADLIEKTQLLEAAVKRNPYFRSGFFHLGCTYLQRGYHSHAFAALKKAVQSDHPDPMCHMLLAQLSLEQMQIEAAWEHLKAAERLTGAGAVPDERVLRLELLRRAPISLSSADRDVEYVDEDKGKPKGLWNWLFASKEPK